MTDINLFPSGLSNWDGTDKPKREHFVNDNRILDQDAMWKADYDPSGEVESLGIPGYVQNLVSVGIGTAVGGIQVKGTGFTEYTHSKVSNAHELTAVSGQGDNIKFTATANYNTGDTISIGSQALSAITPDGEPLSDGAFKTNSVVICYRIGNSLVFTLGGVSASTVMPKAGGTFTGEAYAISSDRSTNSLRNIQVQDSSGNAVSTSWLRFRR